MYQCRLRAFTECQEPVYFTMRDVPVMVHPDCFALMGRPGSPLLRTTTISRAFDTVDIAEGDVVKIAQEECLVTYSRGFLFTSVNGVRERRYLPSDIQLLHIGYHHETKQITFKYKNAVFNLFDVLGTVDGKVLLSGSYALAEPGLIQVSTGMRKCKKRIFYGDVIDGREVVSWGGQPGCWVETGFYSLLYDRVLEGVV